MVNATRIPRNPHLGASTVDAIQAGLANTVAVDTTGDFSTLSVPLSSVLTAAGTAFGGMALAGKGKRGVGFLAGGMLGFALSMANRGLKSGSL